MDREKIIKIFKAVENGELAKEALRDHANLLKYDIFAYNPEKQAVLTVEESSQIFSNPENAGMQIDKDLFDLIYDIKEDTVLKMNEWNIPL